MLLSGGNDRFSRPFFPPLLPPERGEKFYILLRYGVRDSVGLAWPGGDASAAAELVGRAAPPSQGVPLRRDELLEC